MKQYTEVDFATALYEQRHKGAVVEWSINGYAWIEQQDFSGSTLETRKQFDYKYRIVTEVDDPYAELKEAHKAGKVIQYKSSSGVWSDVTPSWCVEPARYRIKPEPKCRPWRTVDEVPIGKIVVSKCGRMRSLVTSALNDSAGILIGPKNTHATIFFEDYTMEDGSPCGVLE